MPAKADIRFIEFDPNMGSPRFEIDIGSNYRFRLDLATDHTLFEASQQGARTVVNFYSTGFQSQPGGGVARVLIPSSGWDALDRSGGRVYFRLASMGNGISTLVISVRPGQSQLAAFFNTVAPGITSLNPDHGPEAGGTSVTITGTHFTGAMEVTFDGQAASFQVVSDTEITAVTPALSPPPISPVPVVVETPGGASAITATSPGFQYEAAATLVAIEVDFPDISVGLPFPGAGAYELPADSGATDPANPRPRTRVVIQGFMDDGSGNRFPAPDGTPIDLAVRTPAVTPAPPQDPPGAWIFLSGGVPLTSNRISLVGGVADIDMVCEPRAPGWKTRQPTAADPSRIEEVFGATYVVTARSEDGSVVGESPVLRIIHGAPHTIELLDAPESAGVQLSDLRAPNGQTPQLGQPLDTVTGAILFPLSLPPVMEVLGPLEIRLGADRVTRDPQTGLVQPVPNAMATLLLFHVKDAAGNPIAILEGDDNNTFRLDVELVRFNRFGLRPFILSPTGQASDPSTTYWRGRVSPNNVLPRGVWGCYLVPAGSVVTSETTIRLGVQRVVNGSPTLLKVQEFTIEADPPAHYAKWSKWFFEGDVSDAPTFLAEIALSLIPIIGDGRDLMIYAGQHLRSRQMGPIDHVIAGLALAGLILDIANVLSLGATAPADAGVGALKAASKLLRHLHDPALARAVGRAIRDRLGDIPRVSMRRDWWRSPEYLELVAFLDDFADFARKIRPLLSDIDKLKTLLGLMGMALLVVSLQDLLRMFVALTIDQIMDLLWGLSALDQVDMTRLG